jgi:vancomycin resistance protein YoaR
MSLTAPSLAPNAENSPSPEAPAKRRDLELTASVVRSLFVIAAVLTIGLMLGAAMYGLSHSNRIYEGVTIAGVEVGGMTRSEARAAIREELSTFNAKPVLLVSDDMEFSLEPEAAGIFLDVDRTVETAFNYGRDGSFFERSGRWFNAIISGRESPIQVTYDEANLDATLLSIAPSIIRPAIDADVQFNAEGQPEIVPELPGRGFDLVATRQQLIQNMAALSTNPVEIVSPIIQANVVVGDLESGLAQTASAVSSPLVIHGVDTNWAMSQEDIRKIVNVGGDTQKLIVDREAVQAFVESIAAASDREARDAGIEVNDDGVLSAVPGQEGVRVRVSETANLIIGALESGSGTVELQYESQSPRISDEQARSAATAGEKMLNAGVTVTWEDGSEDLNRAQLLSALTVQVNPDEDEPFAFGFNSESLTESLSETFDEIEIPVKEPRLRYVDGEISVVEDGQAGEVVAVEQSIENITTALLNGEPEAALVIESQEPELSVPVIDNISLDDVLAEASTYYGDSSDARRHNVEVAAELESGWLIAPGEQFSYAEFVGPVDQDSGFVTGFGIVDDPSGSGVTTAPVVGGGICQVSTTIFQAAFWSGMQIDERYSHPYWIQTYGEPPRGMEGLDAMVNIEDSGSLDLKFTNTTGNWIAVEVIADGTTVDVKVLGTDPGWDINVGQPMIYNEVEATIETRYTDSPELLEGEQLQVEYAQEGFTAEVTRVITDEDGETIDTYSVTSTYSPSQNTILRGTGEPEATPVA